MYSKEFQTFLRNPHNDEIKKIIDQMREENPKEILAKYEEHMKQYENGTCEEQVIASFFLNLDKTVTYFREFKETTKRLRVIRKQEKEMANRFYNIMLIDIKSKIPDADYQPFNEQFQKFKSQNDTDELKSYSNTLRKIEKEMNAF